MVLLVVLKRLFGGRRKATGFERVLEVLALGRLVAAVRGSRKRSGVRERGLPIAGAAVAAGIAAISVRTLLRRRRRRAEAFDYRPPEGGASLDMDAPNESAPGSHIPEPDTASTPAS